MTQKETYEYLESLKTLGSHLGLESVTQLCKRLGNPQDALSFVHVAGTNGKGSVIAMVSETLRVCGYKTGRYISPTVTDYRERFCINGKMISKKALSDYAARVKEACDRMTEDGFSHPTAFEFETALAFLYFQEKDCDIVVLETGMGGMTDATNVITTTIVSVLCSVSMDHMQFLGNDLTKIASVKAGIIKEGVPVVSYPQKEDALRVISAYADEKHAPLLLTEGGAAVLKKVTEKGIRISYRHHKNLLLSLAGAYQLLNAATALEVLDCLKERCGFSISEDQIKKAFSGLSWPGRFEKLSSKPDIYADGAHNEDAARQLSKTIAVYKGLPAFTNKKIVYIIGVLKDKDYDAVIKETYSHADLIITLKPPHNERALDAYELAKAASLYHNNVTAADSIEEAVEMAVLMGGQNAVVVAFGSLSYLGELKAIVQNNKWIRGDSHGR